MSPSAEDAASWALLHEVLRGKRIPPDAYTSKALSFLLRPPSRDAVVTADSFHIVFEGDYRTRRPHPWYLWITPSVVSELLRLTAATGQDLERGACTRACQYPWRPQAAGASRGDGPVASDLAARGSWEAPERRLWLQERTDELRIAVRDASTPASAHPPPLVLLERPESVICEVELTCACPHCGATGARYRELPDGWFVCPTCCRSFARPAA